MEKKLENKLIIYDNHCRICSSLKDIILKITSIPAKQVLAYPDALPKYANQIDAAKFRNGMALIDINGKKTLYGEHGIAYILSAKSQILAFLLRSRLLFYIFTILYRTLAYNRYIIAAPRNSISCDCNPDKINLYRWIYIAICISISIVLTILLGISLAKYFPGLSSSYAAIQMLCIAGTGWIVQIALSRIFLKDLWLDYVGNLGSIMVMGLLIQVPWIVASYIFSDISYYWAILSVIVSSGTMLYMHIYRVRSLGISQYYTWSWFISLQTTAALWIYYFYLNQSL